jgi:hypothetical protein
MKKKIIDSILLLVISDLLINFSAGWFSAVFILPNFIGIHSFFDLSILTGNLVVGIVSLYIGYKLRKLCKGEEI